MACRVGRITRHEDVHGVSGTGDHLADVIEFSDGTAVIRWLGPDGSTNVYGGVKNITNVHGHGGKTSVEWIWEEPHPPDPMDAVFTKKIKEVGGETESLTGPAEPIGATAQDAEAEAIAEEILEEASELSSKVAKKVAEKLAKKTDEKVAEAVAEKSVEDTDAEK